MHQRDDQTRRGRAIIHAAILDAVSKFNCTYLEAAEMLNDEMHGLLREALREERRVASARRKRPQLTGDPPPDLAEWFASAPRRKTVIDDAD